MRANIDPAPVPIGTTSVTRPAQAIHLSQNGRSGCDAAVAGLLGSTAVIIDAGRHSAALELAWKRQLNGWDEV